MIHNKIFSVIRIGIVMSMVFCHNDVASAFMPVAPLKYHHHHSKSASPSDLKRTSTFSSHLTSFRVHVPVKNNKRTGITTTSNTQSSLLSLSPQEIIETGVSLDTFLPQFLWLPMIVAPNSNLTKNLMGSIVPLVLLSLVHLTIVIVAAGQEGALSQIAIFGEVFDPSLSQLEGMTKMFQFPNFVAEEWPHVLVWDLFVGRMIWLDGMERNIDTRVALLFCNGIGPPGFLIHVATCILTGKGLPTMGYNGNEKKDNDEDA